MSTESLQLVETRSLAYRQSLSEMKPTEEAFLAQWYTTLKLALNTAQVTLEQLRSQVEQTNSELAAVQYAQSELTILMNGGQPGATRVSELLSPGSSRDEAYWADTANLADLKAALGIFAGQSDEGQTLEEFLASALAGAADPKTLDGDAAAALSALYGFAGEEFPVQEWQGGTSTDPAAIMADPVFQSRVATLTGDLGFILGDGTLAKGSTIAELRQSIVGQFNVQMFSETAMGSELGATILQYLGQAPDVAGMNEATILSDTSFEDLFTGSFGGAKFSVGSLFDKVDVAVDDSTSLDQLVARLETAHQSKSSLSTLQTLDMKVASQNYSNHLSLLTKMISDRLTDVQNLLREW